MSHNRVRANKNTYDSRAQHRQNRKPPTLNDAFSMLFIHNMSIYSDTPAWKWRGTGKHAYTSSPEAARYVAMCRQREIDKLHKLTIVTPITDSARLIEAASRIGRAA